jgi:hypothetical protein
MISNRKPDKARRARRPRCYFETEAHVSFLFKAYRRISQGLAGTLMIRYTDVSRDRIKMN